MGEAELIDLGEVRLSCRTTGSATAPPLLLLHGLTSDGRSWDGIAAELAEDWRVHVPDLRGHGASDRPGRYSFELLGQDVLALLDALDVPRAVIVGHSMGGVAAYLLAHAHPDRVAALVLEETPPPVPHERPLPPRPSEPLGYDWAVRTAIIGQVNAPDPSWWELLAEIRVPALVVGGGPESPFAQDRIAAMADRLPNGRFRSIPAGHNVHRERPVEFLATVRAWLAEQGIDPIS